jgi:hypothetical protein
MDTKIMEVRIKEHEKEIREAHNTLTDLNIGMTGMALSVRIRELAKKKRTSKTLREAQDYWYNLGKKAGRDEIRRGIVEALGLDERYEFTKEDE